MPQRLRRSDPTAADATVITPIAAEAGDSRRSRSACAETARKRSLGQFALGASGLAEFPRSPGKPAVLRLGEADVLGKTLILPLAAERELDQALAFEMDRETPFKPEELYWNHRIEAADRQTGRIVGAPAVDPKGEARPAACVSRLRPVSPPVRAEIADGPDAGSWLPLDGDGQPVHPGASRLVRPAAACCAALALAAIVIAFRAPVDGDVEARPVSLASGRAAAAEADRPAPGNPAFVGQRRSCREGAQQVGQPLAVLAAATDVCPTTAI